MGDSFEILNNLKKFRVLFSTQRPGTLLEPSASADWKVGDTAVVLCVVNSFFMEVIHKG
jgi:hypothetical protein